MRLHWWLALLDGLPNIAAIRCAYWSMVGMVTTGIGHLDIGQ